MRFILTEIYLHHPCFCREIARNLEGGVAWTGRQSDYERLRPKAPGSPTKVCARVLFAPFISRCVGNQPW
jgi:hypothetical protein